MMKCIRRPSGWSGSKWKTSRCSQYSVSVQNTRPPANQATIGPVLCRVAPNQISATMAGTKMNSGTLQWTRENLSSRSESNMRGEARRTSERRVGAGPVAMNLILMRFGGDHDVLDGNGEE